MVGAVAGLLDGGVAYAASGMTWAGQPVGWAFTPDALWLLGLGLVPAGLAAALGTPAREGRCGWLFGLALTLLGALGVFALQDAPRPHAAAPPRPPPAPMPPPQHPAIQPTWRPP